MFLELCVLSVFFRHSDKKNILSDLPIKTSMHVNSSEFCFKHIGYLLIQLTEFFHNIFPQQYPW